MFNETITATAKLTLDLLATIDATDLDPLVVFRTRDLHTTTTIRSAPSARFNRRGTSLATFGTQGVDTIVIVIVVRLNC